MRSQHHRPCPAKDLQPQLLWIHRFHFARLRRCYHRLPRVRSLDHQRRTMKRRKLLHLSKTLARSLLRHIQCWENLVSMKEVQIIDTRNGKSLAQFRYVIGNSTGVVEVTKVGLDSYSLMQQVHGLHNEVVMLSKAAWNDERKQLQRNIFTELQPIPAMADQLDDMKFRSWIRYNKTGSMTAMTSNNNGPAPAPGSEGHDGHGVLGWKEFTEVFLNVCFPQISVQNIFCTTFCCSSLSYTIIQIGPPFELQALTVCT